MNIAWAALLAAWTGAAAPAPTAEELDAVRSRAEAEHKDLDREGRRYEAPAEPAPVAKVKTPRPKAPPPAPPPPAAEPEPVKAKEPQPPAPSAQPPAPKPEAMTWDFETGDLAGWTRSGAAFAGQPTFGDNPTARGRGQASNHQGRYWIGTFEDRRAESDPAGRVQGDGPTGTLTSRSFMIEKPAITFLVGGGCDAQVVRAELVIAGKTVRHATGKCSETMEIARWDVTELKGKTAFVRLVDKSAGGWGHLNFDALEFGD